MDVDKSVADLPTQDYELSWFQAGDYQDNHGNTWCNAAFVGVSEPVRWVVKDPTQVKIGEKYYGHFTLETGRGSGKSYLRFRKEQKPDFETPPATGNTKREWQPRDDEAIKKQWAYGRAYEVVKPKTQEDWLKVKSDGDKLLSFVNGQSLKVEAQLELGVEPNYDDDAEFQSMLEKGLEADGISLNDEPEINLNDIPF